MPALTDFIFMVNGISHMFIAGPSVTKSVMREEVSMQDLGETDVQGRTSGVADFRVNTEQEMLPSLRE
jgi:acetyl-CoA carboxylase carboxyltransferase component